MLDLCNTSLLAWVAWGDWVMANIQPWVRCNLDSRCCWWTSRLLSYFYGRCCPILRNLHTYIHVYIASIPLGLMPSLIHVTAFIAYRVEVLAKNSEVSDVQTELSLYPPCMRTVV
ncbi:uncharacterized protein BCR38DRAFT_153873 [Pseudomassariella vexata]|uniref:Uncharacterized protein n=1 Tax=Pseudomassariella vexata TaxID=1141098 RepID=A0A1Y2E6S6_9PEZI|nr:uncharacterized protein BCR38DRAFT_153873 [Pseudomassariella vexata]ORY67268.1 hypothetical protein BCR38DRAFT_153873 [Pseudomassariella vexata]